jgi:hypothetical protein
VVRSGPSTTCSTCSPTRPGSGLHVGHPEGYTATDIVARYKRMRASTSCTRWAGTPSACPPSSTPSRRAPTRRETTRATSPPSAQLKMPRLLLRLGPRGQHHDPDYYRWTQWIFLKLYERGPGLRGRGPGQLVPRARHRARQRGGHRRRSERGGHPVERRPMRSGCCDHRLRRAPARRPRRPRLARVGQGDAAQLDRQERGRRGRFASRARDRVRVFTTRPDTLFGATYMVLAPEHPLVDEITTAGAARRSRPTSEAARKKRPRPHRPGQGPRPASSPAPTRSTRSTAPRSRSGSPTTCSWATAPARSWPCPPRRARLRVRQASSACPSSRSCERAATTPRSTAAAYTDDGTACGELRPTTGLSTATALKVPSDRDRSPPGSRRRASARQGQLQAARLAVQPPALLGRALPHRAALDDGEPRRRCRGPAGDAAGGRRLQAHRHGRAAAGAPARTGCGST